MITSLGGMPLSRDMALMLQRADQEQAREAKAAREAEARKQEDFERQELAYYYEHGETRSQTMYRMAAEQDRREQRELARARQERQEAYRENMAVRMMAGWRPKTHEEILNIARMAS